MRDLQRSLKFPAEGTPSREPTRVLKLCVTEFVAFWSFRCNRENGAWPLSVEPGLELEPGSIYIYCAGV